MRRIREAVLPATWNNDDLPKTVREYREKYKGVSRILDAHPEILELVHQDLKRLSCGGPRGREGDFTSETILRALVVHAIEGLSLREIERHEELFGQTPEVLAADMGFCPDEEKYEELQGRAGIEGTGGIGQASDDVT